MRASLECASCAAAFAWRSVAFATSDLDIRERVVRDAARAIAEMDFSAPPILVGWRVLRLIGELTGHADHYHEAKRLANEAALAMLPHVRRRVAAAPSPLHAALSVAAAANAFDAGTSPAVDFAGVLLALADETGQSIVGPVDDLAHLAARARRIVYVADNAGEIVFDRLVIESLGAGKTTLVVRGGPILNDATMEDARATGLTELVRTIDTGCDAPGLLLARCSAECRRTLEEADLIVCKGQGNFESLDGTALEAPVFFALKVKCPVMAEALGASEGDLVLHRAGGIPDEGVAHGGAVRPSRCETPGAALREALHPHCVVCSPRNPRGLGLRFEPAPEEGGVAAELTCAPSLEGYRGVVHGGVVSAVLDGAMANCLFEEGRSGRTARLTVRFRHPVLARGTAQVSARLLRSRGRFAELSADLTQENEVKASARGVFMLDEADAGPDEC
jgi:damage-control phosphatase, subfamily I